MSTAKTHFAGIELDSDWLLRIFSILPIILVLFAGAATIWIYFLVLSLLPESQSVVETAGLRSEVKVVRDINGVPGIIAESEEDLAFVFGYTVAQDRLWQIDFLRRAGQGKLSEILGQDYLGYDFLQRALSGGNNLKEEIERLQPSEKNFIDHFVQGINRYISQNYSKLPIEFSLLEYKPDPFTIEDVQSIARAFAVGCSPSLRIDPVAAQVFGRIGNQGKTLFPSTAGNDSSIIPPELIGWESKSAFYGKQIALLPSLPKFFGGNVFLINAERSSTQKPIWASCVNQSLTAPDFYYRARLSAKNLFLNGEFIPGIPMPIAGNNGKLVWNCVPAYVDDADLFLERIDETGKNFWRIDRWRKLEESRNEVLIKGSRPATIKINSTENGPIVTELNKSTVLSVRWTGREHMGLIGTLANMSRAQDAREFLHSMKTLTAPILKVVWSDDRGNAGIQVIGKIPIRRHDSNGIIPQPGWTGLHDWIGFLPVAMLPSTINPKTPVISIPGYLSGFDDSGLSHFHPVTEKSQFPFDTLFRSTDQSKESLQQNLQDCFSPMAMDLTPRIISGLGNSQEITAAEKKAVNLLKPWNFQMTKDSAPAAIFGLFYDLLLEELFYELLGEQLFSEYIMEFPVADRAIHSIFKASEHSPEIAESLNTSIIRAFSKAVSRGTALAGSNPEKWKWGDFNRIKASHPISLKSGSLGRFYSVDAGSGSGFRDTIQLSFGVKTPWNSQYNASTLKMIVDNAAQTITYSVTPLGPSGIFFSNHYKDFLNTWLAGKLLKNPIDGVDLRKEALSQVVFKPTEHAAASLKSF